MSFNKNKCDADLGRRVHEYLVQMGVETPTIENNLSRTDKIEIIERKFKDIMETLGLDLTDDSLEETPTRTTVDNKMHYDEMVIEKNITVQSLCEHHILPIVGKATIAYVPNKKVLGLSKMPRIVEYFSRRPQIQERLTEQVYHALCFILDTDAVAVVIEAEHLCVSSRGVEDTHASTITSKLGPAFKSDPALRAEFMNLVLK